MSTVYATTADIEARWRALTAEETTQAEFLLEYASEIIRQEIPSVDTRITAGTLSATLVKGVTVEMVKRALQNPEGLRSTQTEEAIEDYRVGETKTLDNSVSTGSVYLSESERNVLLGRSSGAFSITPAPPANTCLDRETARARRAAWDVCW